MSRQTLPLSIHVGIQTRRANPLRTVLSTLGVVMGAASLVAVPSIGDGSRADERQR
jgi:putative ABC transport system permease protein